MATKWQKKLEDKDQEQMTAEERQAWKREQAKQPKIPKRQIEAGEGENGEEASYQSVMMIMMMMQQIQQQHQQAMLQLQEQFKAPAIEPPPEIRRRSPINIKMQREQIRQRLQKEMEEEREKRIRLADTVYTDFSMLDEETPTVLKAGLLRKGEQYGS